jgi:membrane-associated protein
MDLIKQLFDLFLHLDEVLQEVITQYGAWTYGLLFLVIFIETGVVVMPFLPGDSLIFAAAAFAKKGALNPWLLFFLLTAAAIIGDTVNYWIGHTIGARAYTGEIKWVKKEYMDRTHAFFEKHGGKTIVLARFVPIIRTFAPFVAGVSRMSYGYFITYNVVGGTLWVALFTILGYFFSTIPFVEKNFEIVIIAIILISVIPALYEAWKMRQEGKTAKAESETTTPENKTTQAEVEAS